MSKISRILISVAVLGVAALTISALTLLGSQSEGPLGRMLADVGSVVSRTENQMAAQVRGPGRASNLQWFQRIRADRARMADPEEVLLGAYDDKLPGSFEGILRMEEAVGRSLPLIHYFTAWGDAPEHAFPRKMVETVWEIGSLPVITWEPWLSTFDAARRDHLPPSDERDRGGMAAIARGEYDFYLNEWFSEAADVEHPILVRFGHEMNDAYRYAWGPHNNTAEEYIAAYRHVVQTARDAGASNILWVWSPHIAYENFEEYYPGDDVVDWVATTVLNYGDIAYWSEWWTFDDIFTRKYDRLAAYKKPIMIAELGTLMAGGERAPWFAQALARLPQRLPMVRAVVFFHARSDATITYQALDWTFDKDQKVIAAVRAAIETWKRAHNQLDTAGTGDSPRATGTLESAHATDPIDGVDSESSLKQALTR